MFTLNDRTMPVLTCSRRQLLIATCLVGLLTSCSNDEQQLSITTTEQLDRALAEAAPGDEIILADGQYSAPKPITRGGTLEKPIVIRAANILGSVLTGGTFQIDADHVVVQGIDFVSCTVQAGKNARAASFRLWRCRFRDGGGFAIRLYNAPDFEGAYCQVGPQWRGRGFGFALDQGSVRPVWRHSMFRDTPEGYGEIQSSGNGEAMHYAFDNGDDEANGLIHRCKFKNWNSDGEIISIKCAKVTIRQCCAEDCEVGAFNNRFGHSNTWEGCWTKNCRGIGVRDGWNNDGSGRQNKVLGCIVEDVTDSSRGIFAQMGDWLPPDNRPSNAFFPSVRNLVIAGCTGPVNVSRAYSGLTIPTRDTRIRQHSGTINDANAVGTDSQPNEPETLYTWAPAIWLEDDDVGPFAG